MGMFLQDVFIIPLITIGGKVTQGCQPIQCSNHVFPCTLVWTTFLLPSQMAQHLQPCSSVLYSCFSRETSGYIAPLVMLVYTVGNVCSLLTASQNFVCFNNLLLQIP